MHKLWRSVQFRKLVLVCRLLAIFYFFLRLPSIFLFDSALSSVLLNLDLVSVCVCSSVLCYENDAGGSLEKIYSFKYRFSEWKGIFGKASRPPGLPNAISSGPKTNLS